MCGLPSCVIEVQQLSMAEIQSTESLQPSVCPNCSCPTCKEGRRKEKVSVPTFRSRDAESPDNAAPSKGPYYYCHRDLRVQSENYFVISDLSWYYPNTSSETAKNILRHSDVGVFILRNSQDPRYLYSISVKTPRGTTSIRIAYKKGYFQLDCVEKLKNLFPRFNSVIALVDYYVRINRENVHNTNRFLESSGRKDMSVLLTSPKQKTVPRLEHLCRLSINRSLPNSGTTEEFSKCVSQLPLPRSCKEYIQHYRFLN